MPIELIDTPACGTCRFWKQLPRNANTLAGPQPGECRFILHATAHLIPQGMGMAPKFAHSAFYAPVHAQFEACAQHERVTPPVEKASC